MRTIRCIEYCLEAERRMDLKDLYHKYKLEPLDMRRKRNLLKMMISESKQDTNIDVTRPCMTLRSSNNVKMKHKFTRLSKIQKSPYYRGLSLWGKLPLEMQHIDTKKEFKDRIKKCVITS